MLFEPAELELCALNSMISTEEHSLKVLPSNHFLSEYLHNIFMKYECCFR